MREILVATRRKGDRRKIADRRSKRDRRVVGKRRLKVLYVTQAEVEPPTFVFFVNDPALLHFSYRRYLENRIRDAFGFEGTAIRMRFRSRTPEQLGVPA